MIAILCGKVPTARKATLRRIKDQAGEVIDQALILWFPAPGSFTGEDVFELQLHGGSAVVEATFRAIDNLGGRLAEPGEFTRRAFEAGRLDLAQAEAVADLVDAETEAQRRQALRQLGGALLQRGERWREMLLSALAFLNAQIDFPDEDLPEDTVDRALAPLRILVQEIEEALSDVRGERVRDGLRIALIGAPNAGKSSLFNALVKRDAAIVAAKAGTTRDVIEAPLTLGGFKVVLADMAGVRAATEEIEAEGVRRALAWAQSADLRVWAVDSSMQSTDHDIERLIQPGDIQVFTKGDLFEPYKAAHIPRLGGITTVTASVMLSSGMDHLIGCLEDWVSNIMSGSDFPAVTRIRHRRLLEEARDGLARALDHTGFHAEIIAADVGLAMRALESLAGRADAEAILDRVFSTFCIGK